MGVSTYVDQGDQQGLVDALAKRRAGQRLTNPERRLIARYESTQRDKIGSEYVRNVPKRQLFEWSGRQAKQWLEWANKYGIPYTPGKDVPSVDLTAVCHWLAEFLSRYHVQLAVVMNDQLMTGTNSPALERWRNAKADIAEYERLEKMRKLVSLELVHETHLLMSSALRKFGEQLERDYGRDAGDLYRDAIHTWERQVEEFLEQFQGKTDDPQEVATQGRAAVDGHRRLVTRPEEPKEDYGESSCWPG